MIKILYFASLRERLGRASEDYTKAPLPVTAGDLLAALSARGGVWSETLPGESAAVKIAINQRMANIETPIEDGDEVAFFPPVTGG